MTTTHTWIDEITMEELDRDPNPIYERLRREAPVAYVPAVGMHVVATRELCLQITQDPQAWSTVIAPSGGRTFGKGTVLDSNGEQHRRIREWIDPQLRPTAVDTYVEALVRPQARRILESIEDLGAVDIQEAYFAPVSVRAVGDLMGLTDVSSETLVRWFQTLALSYGNAAVDEHGNFADPAPFEAGDRVKEEIVATVDPMLDHWTSHPDHTLISHWLHDGMPEGQVRDRAEIYPNIYVFLLGALQEPGHVMTTTLAGLLQHPDQLERVVDDPALVPRAINEGARWVAPIWSAAVKVANHDVTIGGVDLPAGTPVILAYGSANRDETAWENPEAYDVDRPVVPHLAFGSGNHACAGTYLGTAIVRIALEELFETIPNIEPDPDHAPDFWGWTFRGPQGLRVRWEV
ncbi:cytochrome P450 monooxygenase [Rhodococcus ruber BKS 20-38]|uniref:Cytochrome P450 monooxygenase n=1 Tax=Rhodococcus ruber BKS 20-38 TaxID=1278076 RepID=M2ZD83_9NOCA|nr:cytochrome P450 [Rhodococcus ruber]EME65237.1 cytochrome P450 monooxygenase [Rhodococcus ruber BKS 20-38]